jgi:hypothetical protein
MIFIKGLSTVLLIAATIAMLSIRQSFLSALCFAVASSLIVVKWWMPMSDEP